MGAKLRVIDSDGNEVDTVTIETLAIVEVADISLRGYVLVCTLYDAVNTTSTGIKAPAANVNVELEVGGSKKSVVSDSRGRVFSVELEDTKVKVKDGDYKSLEITLNPLQGENEVYLWKKNAYGR